MKKIDIHAHMGKTSSGEGNNVHDLVKSMDQFGILETGISSLSGVVTRTQNDLVKHCMDAYPDRIRGYAFINPKAPDVMDEIEKCLGDYKMNGVKFHPWKHGYYSDNTPQIDEVLSEIERYGVHVQVHVGTSPLCTPYAWIRYAKKHPKLKFLFTHMGCREFGYSVIHAAADIKNIWLETSVIYDRDVLENVRGFIGSKRIVFGSDWPYKSVETEIAKVLKMGFDDLELEDVYYKNAEFLLSGGVLDEY